jgi:hypothetical protein
MKYILLFVLALSIVSIPSIALAVAPIPASTGCSDGGGGMWTPKCPFCQSILPVNNDVASPFYTVYHTDIWGNQVMDTVVKCKVCGYDGARDSKGMIRTITQEALAEWGARNWDINK